MPTQNNDLSEAIVIFLAFGSAPAPRQDYDGLVKKFGAGKGAELATLAIALIADANNIKIDWSKHTLVSAGQAVRTEMQARHPELSDLALRALEWKFTFDWR